jgi:hypothetical protein
MRRGSGTGDSTRSILLWYTQVSKSGVHSLSPGLCPLVPVPWPLTNIPDSARIGNLKTPPALFSLAGWENNR